MALEDGGCVLFCSFGVCGNNLLRMEFMEIPTYYQNGTTEILDYYCDAGNTFLIQSMIDIPVDYESISRKYRYTGDHLFMNTIEEISYLDLVIVKRYFTDLDYYYNYLNKYMMLGLTEGGYDAESAISSKNFINLLEKCLTFSEEYKPVKGDKDSLVLDLLPNDLFKLFYDNRIDVVKYLYVQDVCYLISSIQNILEGMNDDFILYYVELSKVNLPKNMNDWKVQFISGGKAVHMASIISQYFIKAASILDILSKLTYEFENEKTSFDKFLKLPSHKITYGASKKFNINRENGEKYKNSIFYRDETIATIESFRNEVIHNGCWEMIPKIYLRTENKKVIERFMLYPDMENGNFCQYQSRRHFYSKGLKVNDALIDIHFKLLAKIACTVKYLKEPIVSNR